MKLTLSQAAKEAGISKSTLSRAIGKGRLSAIKDDFGRFQIDPAELFRVFSPVAKATDKSQHPERDATLLEQEIKHLQDMISALKEREADLKAERDSWKEQAQRLALPRPEGGPSKSILQFFHRGR